MRYLFTILVLLLVIVSACTTRVVPSGPLIKKIDSEELSKLVINFSVKMKREHRLDLEDSWAAYDDQIKKICLRYSSQQLLEMKEARLLLVELVEEFLARLNNHSVLGFQLETSPFTANNLDVQINFESFYGYYLDPLYIGLIWLQAGCTHFYAFDRKNPDIDWDHHRFEPYFKSRELALFQKEADLPYELEAQGAELLRPGTHRPESMIYDRYRPYRTYPPYAPGVQYSPGAIMPYRGGPVQQFGRPLQPSYPVQQQPMNLLPPTYPGQQPYSANSLYMPSPMQQVGVPAITPPALSTPTYMPYKPLSSYTPSTYSSPGFYMPTSQSDLPAYNPNVPATEGRFYNPYFYNDLPPYNPSTPANQ